MIQIPGLILSRAPNTSARSLLVIAILLPQLLAQLRILFVHCRFAQLACNHVVVSAIGNIRRDCIGTAATAGTAAQSSASTIAALQTTARPLTLTLTTRTAAACAAISISVRGTAAALLTAGPTVAAVRTARAA